MHIGDDIGLAIHRAVIQIEEPLGFVVTGHVAALRISRTLLDLPRLRLPGWRGLGLFSMSDTILLDRTIQLIHISLTLRHGFSFDPFTLVGIGLELGGVVIQDMTGYQLAFDGLKDNLIKDL